MGLRVGIGEEKVCCGNMLEWKGNRKCIVVIIVRMEWG
jgi:hypothetical protein